MVKRITQMGVLLSFTLILCYVESQIPFSFGIPGIKLGLANFSIVMTLYLLGEKEAIFMNGMRILLSSFLFGNMSLLLYSLAGGIFSMMIMIIMKKVGCFSCIGVSMGGGVFHNLGQLLVAYFVVKTKGLIFYLPVLMIVGLITGAVNGIIFFHIQKYLVHYIRNSRE